MEIQETSRITISLNGKNENEIRGAICYLQNLLVLEAPITIKASEKIRAIRFLRDVSGKTLKESKDAVETIIGCRTATSKKQIEILGLANFYSLKRLTGPIPTTTIE